MANEFQELAQELINEEFVEYAKILTLTIKGVWDPVTETYNPPPQNHSANAIRIELENSQFENQKIQIGDFLVIFPAIDVPVTPSIVNEVTFDGTLCQILREMIDPADAAWQLVLRKL